MIVDDGWIEVAVHTAPDVGTSIDKFPPNLEDP